MEKQVNEGSGIIYSYYAEETRPGEQCISEHSLGYITSGKLLIIDGDRVDTFKEGDFILPRKNNLAKFIKQPATGGQFTAITVVFDKDTLLNYSKEQQLTGGAYPRRNAVLSIPHDNLLKSYFDSLLPYFDEPVTDELIRYKKREAILLLLRKNPALKDVLFDFGTPGKIDLEAFMNRNFRYNVSLEKMAYLAGRSLASFKRDFEKIFHTSPNRWIQQQRLKEAHFLISKKKIKPSDVYLEVGFESLSHFSYAFKQLFGKNPSSV